MSPDGNVLATASLDGHVKFWDIQNPNSSPKCLHDWEPHQGRPVSRIIFCDNHIDQDSNLPFWRFLLTGTEKNKELKLWCTVTWRCLQTVRFHPHDEEEEDNSNDLSPCLQMTVDLSASHLVLSDIKRKVVYVIHIQQDLESGLALMTSISEFILTQPLLSFAVANVEKRDQAQDNDDDMLSGDVLVPVAISVSEDVSVTRVLLKMYCIHTRSMQELTLRFLLSQAIDIKMALEGNVENSTVDVQDESGDVNGLLSIRSEKLENEQADKQLIHLGEPVKLMAPGEFTIPSHTSLPASHATEGITSGLESITTSTVSIISNLSIDEETLKTSAAEASFDSVSQLKSSSLQPFTSLMSQMSPIMTVGGLCRPSPIGLFQPSLAPVHPDRTVNEIGDTVDIGTESGAIDPGNDKEEDEESLPALESSPLSVSVSSSLSEELPKQDEQTTEDDLRGQRPLPLFPSASGPDQMSEESEKEVDKVAMSLIGKADHEEQTELIMMPVETEEPVLDETKSNLESPTLPLPLDDPLLKE
jgi:enhancer of mRNA-decapping protein 4